MIVPSTTCALRKLYGDIVTRLTVLLLALYPAAPAAAQPPAPIPEQPAHVALLIAAITGGGLILVVGLMRWYGQRQAQRRREEQADEETAWDRVQRHLEQADVEDDSIDGPR